ncbi:hypothetical protein [Rhodococcus sp. Q]|uniref:hypothetical protein n=1 Tax=Rhodococcus sp. Q TaxID=2502252 RepID=UPI001485BDAC|nr:hypothetical protein [Rhodococcus sp. Q]
MRTKSLVAGVVSAGFLAASVWGASAVVNAGMTAGPGAPAPVSAPAAFAATR